MKKLVAYPAVLDDSRNHQGVYTVTFPDVPGAISQGKTVAEAIKNGSTALGLMLYDQQPLPTASSLDDVRQHYLGKIVTLIAVDLNEIKKHVKKPTVKKNTTIPGYLAHQAEAAGINFSQTLTEALRRKLANKRIVKNELTRPAVICQSEMTTGFYN